MYLGTNTHPSRLTGVLAPCRPHPILLAGLMPGLGHVALVPGQPWHLLVMVTVMTGRLAAAPGNTGRCFCNLGGDDTISILRPLPLPNPPNHAVLLYSFVYGYRSVLVSKKFTQSKQGNTKSPGRENKSHRPLSILFLLVPASTPHTSKSVIFTCPRSLPLSRLSLRINYPSSLLTPMCDSPS
jgi:hypothetical protein